MNWHRRLGRRIDALMRPEDLDRDVQEEMRLHVELEAAEIARVEGVPPDEARRRALVAFGGLTQFQEEHRSVRGVGFLEHTGRELRQAVRGLMHRPGFSLAGVGVANPVLYTMIWVVIILAVFVPWCTRAYNKSANR